MHPESRTKTVLLTAYGDVDKLELREVPDPTPGPNQIEVRMAGASINPVDWKLRSGALVAWMPLLLPATLGRDAVTLAPTGRAFPPRRPLRARVLNGLPRP